MKMKTRMFEPISFAQLQKDVPKVASRFTDEVTWVQYWCAKLEPKRGSSGSAGYDLLAPFDFDLQPGEEIVVPTCTKVFIAPELNQYLDVRPRSGAGFKCYTRLANTVGVIDADYHNSEKTEGHVFVKIRNESLDKCWEVEEGQGFAQSIFTQFFLTDNDSQQTLATRTGGFGSTDS